MIIVSKVVLVFSFILGRAVSNISIIYVSTVYKFILYSYVRIAISDFSIAKCEQYKHLYLIIPISSVQRNFLGL